MTGTRNEIVMIRLTPAEKQQVREKMAELGIQNMSAYFRKMALDGYCVRLDLVVRQIKRGSNRQIVRYNIVA